MLVFREEGFPFSVVATTMCEVLAITKHDLFNKLPKDIKEFLEEKAN